MKASRSRKNTPEGPNLEVHFRSEGAGVGDAATAAPKMEGGGRRERPVKSGGWLCFASFKWANP